MEKREFTPAEIYQGLQELNAARDKGVSIADYCRKRGDHRSLFDRWRYKYGERGEKLLAKHPELVQANGHQTNDVEVIEVTDVPIRIVDKQLRTASTSEMQALREQVQELSLYNTALKALVRELSATNRTL